MARRGFFAELNYQAQQAEKRRTQPVAAAHRAQAHAQREAERTRRSFSDQEEAEEKPSPKAAVPGGISTQGTGEKCPVKYYYKFKNIKNNISYDWNDSATNRTSRMQKYEVKAEVATKYTMGASISVSAELKVRLLASAKVELGINASYEKSTSYGSKMNLEVPAKTRIKADRGMWQEKFAFSYTKIGSTCLRSTGKGKAWAPKRSDWIVYEEKL